MITLGILGSGSSGNSIIVENGAMAFAVDNGFSFNEFSRRAKSLELDINKIKLFLLTHSHIDHIYGARSLSNKLGIPLFCHKDTRSSYLNHEQLDKRYLFQFKKTYSYFNESLQIYPIKTFHDSRPSSGFYLKMEDMRFLFLTDNGSFNNEMVKLAFHAHVIFLESNYDPSMLKHGPYPSFLKRRISARTGHLSNQDALKFIDNLFRSSAKVKVKEKYIFLSHLSETNNSPELVLSGIKEKFAGIYKEHCNAGNHYLELNEKGLKIKLFILKRDKPCKYQILNIT